VRILDVDVDSHAYYPIFADSGRFEINVERALIRTRSGVIILAFTNVKEVAGWNWQETIHDSPDATTPTYAVRSLDEGKTWQDLQKLHDEWTGANRDIIETRNGNMVIHRKYFPPATGQNFQS